MDCGYDTQTVLEVLSDIDTDNGINSDRIYGDSNRDSCRSDSCAYELRNYVFTFQFIRKVRKVLRYEKIWSQHYMYSSKYKYLCALFST